MFQPRVLTILPRSAIYMHKNQSNLNEHLSDDSPDQSFKFMSAQAVHDWSTLQTWQRFLSQFLGE